MSETILWRIVDISFTHIAANRRCSQPSIELKVYLLYGYIILRAIGTVDVADDAGERNGRRDQSTLKTWENPAGSD